MTRNRSVPDIDVIPVLAYPDVNEAADWLCRAFGFRVRLRIGDHRAQLMAGSGAVILVQGVGGAGSVHVRVEDVDGHQVRALAAGAIVSGPPETFPFGERQYSATDLAGNTWTFSESVEDVDPATWGATDVHLDP
jgi:uncharacterized glyoxalase superfamily protein PhnB